MNQFDLNNFISIHVTGRKESLFLADMEEHRGEIKEKLEGKCLLVIGGAGTIGSSFIRAALPYHPASLVVVDTNENALTELVRSLRAGGNEIPAEFITYPMRYQSTSFVKMFEAHGGFDLVANFAAHKHVRSEKDIYSIEEMLRNNVLDARQLLFMLMQRPPETYFCVSSDKAANPVNLMGASKRLMEDLIFGYAERFPTKTARFANVAFSNGSLLDGIMYRMAAREPFSAPKDVKRYFVSPEESGQICLLAATVAKAGEIVYPKLSEGKLMNLAEIVEALLRENGYEPLYCDSDEEAIARMKELPRDSREFPVHFFRSDTDGEKLFEEFVAEGEEADLTRFQELGVISAAGHADLNRINRFLGELSDQLTGGTTKEDLVRKIGEYLPNFAHIQTGKSLDSKI